MGDHRASIQIKMSFHGVEREADMWINYCGDSAFTEVDGVDRQVIDWFRGVYEEGMDRWYSQEAERRAGEFRAREEKMERAELARLQEKYPLTQDDL